MLHNPKRLHLIETVSRWFAWLNFVSAVAYAVFFMYRITTDSLHFNLVAPTFPMEILGFWEKAPEVTKSIFTIFGALASFLFMLGVSKAVRFLRAYYAQVTAVELDQQIEI